MDKQDIVDEIIEEIREIKESQLSNELVSKQILSIILSVQERYNVSLDFHSIEMIIDSI